LVSMAGLGAGMGERAGNIVVGNRASFVGVADWGKGRVTIVGD